MKTRLTNKVRTRVINRQLLVYSIAGGTFIIAVGIILTIWLLGNNINGYSAPGNNGKIYAGQSLVTINKETIYTSSYLVNFCIRLKFESGELKTRVNGGLLESGWAEDILFYRQGGANALDYNVLEYNPELGVLNVSILVDTLWSDKNTGIMFYYGSLGQQEKPEEEPV